ncbi:HIT family protein [Stigmatella aurantiaca DW4/3-1]|uniref:HIT family protein n=2 Tax=Stigmatella aurantiaca TaxID=41 RepID=E3FL47_STIAD|nr:HIT family protein [Stigmatella aurantiaca DW4/3-1]
MWQALLDGSGCPICKRGLPLHVIANLECSWLTMSEDAPMPGYVCLVSKVHVIELHELEEARAEAFMRDIRSVSKALSIITEAVKLNYEIHGNTLPHLHMHFFPRYVGDPFEGKAIEPRAVTQPVYAPGQFAEVKSRLLAALDVDAD